MVAQGERETHYPQLKLHVCWSLIWDDQCMLMRSTHINVFFPFPHGTLTRWKKKNFSAQMRFSAEIVSG